MFLSVITPTYNRAYILRQCYESLLAQTDGDFEWIVVDDGSADDTAALIQSFLDEKKLNIRYIAQENGGKNRAHNTGVLAAQGELCVCLDSDDAFSPHAVAVAKEIWKTRSRADAIGILAKRGNLTDHAPICGDWPDTLAACRMMELQSVYGFTGDTVLFFDTALMKAHLFWVFEGEKFTPEDGLYAELDRSGVMLLAKQVLYYCEYLPDGLTARYAELLRRNPVGTSYAYYQRSLTVSGFSQKLHNAIIAQAYRQFAKKKRPYPVKDGRLVMTLAELFAPLYRKLKMKG